MNYTYEYPRPSVSADCVVFGLDHRLNLLLIRRGNPPFKGKWALPGGFVEIDENLENGARRELAEETGIRQAYLRQLHAFGNVHRDPRGRVISVAYLALVRMAEQRVQAADDAADAAWYAIHRLPDLAFDHREIVNLARQELKLRIRIEPLGYELLPKKFTLRQLQGMYQAILGRRLDRRNFRRKVLGLEILVPLDEFESGVPYRAARLYRFDKARYRSLAKQGMDVDF